MKIKLFLLISVIIIGFSFCHRGDDNFKSEGIILGPDIRMCICCGGWLIKIDTVTYNFNELPAGSRIDLQTAIFPLKVKLDWQISDPSPCQRYITILRIEKE